MSNYECWVGSAKPFIEELTEEKAYDFLINTEKVDKSTIDEIYKLYGSYFDVIRYEPPDYQIVGKTLYKLDLKVAGETYEDLEYVSKKEDGKIDFVFSFYNGGTGFEEVFEEAIEKSE